MANAKCFVNIRGRQRSQGDEKQIKAGVGDWGPPGEHSSLGREAARLGVGRGLCVSTRSSRLAEAMGNVPACGGTHRVQDSEFSC